MSPCLLRDLASLSLGITDVRTGPLSREDQSLGLSVLGRLPFATLGWVSGWRGGEWNVFGGIKVSKMSGGCWVARGNDDGLGDGAGKMLGGEMVGLKWWMRGGNGKVGGGDGVSG